MQGWRCEMEDAYYAKARLFNPLDEWSFFAVFDGHAGCKVWQPICAS
jgi:protein phosphatase 1B